MSWGVVGKDEGGSTSPFSLVPRSGQSGIKMVPGRLLWGFAGDKVAKVNTVALLRNMHVVCNRPHEDGRSVRDQDQTLEDGVTFFNSSG